MTEPGLKSMGNARLALGLFLAGLLYLGYQILHVFLPSIAWAVISIVTLMVRRRLNIDPMAVGLPIFPLRLMPLCLLHPLPVKITGGG